MRRAPMCVALSLRSGQSTVDGALAMGLGFQTPSWAHCAEQPRFGTPDRRRRAVPGATRIRLTRGAPCGQLLGCTGNRKVKGRPPTQHAFGPDPTTVCFHDRLRNGKPEPGPDTPRAVGLPKAVE